MTSDTLRSRLRPLSTGFAIAVIAIGLLVLAGWAVNSRALKSVIPGMITMKVNTAACLILLSVALLGLQRPSHRWAVAIRVCLGVVFLLSTITLAEYVFGLDLRIDNLVFYDYDSPRFPGRNAPATNVAFLGMVGGLLLLHMGTAATAAQVLLALVAAAPLATLGGYLYRAPGMYQNAPYPVIALNTSVALMLLCLGGLFARADQGIMGIVTSRSLAGALGRKLLPAAVGLPLLTGLLVLGGERAGLYTAVFGSALLVACCSIFFAGAVCWTITLLWKTEVLRAVAEQDRQRLLESEQIARGQAEMANRMKDEFLSVVSHELRTPLNAILGWTQILRGSDDANDLAQGLDVIERNGRSQHQIIEDLLDMSRIVSGKVRLDVSQTDMSGIVAAAIQSLQPLATAKGVQVEPLLDPDAAEVRGDPVRLQQIVWNLLSNAIKFTPRGGTIRITTEAIDGIIRITVIDTGIGIDPAFLPHIFERFRQADASTTRSHGGLGLGLAIVKQLVELHGGAVRGASDGPGRGSQFTVELPRSKHTASAGVAGTASGVATLPGAIDIGGIRVLVIDDEPDARAFVKRLLEDRHAVVTAVGSGEEALPLVETRGFNVLISDIGMPGEDGYAVIRRVRSLGQAHGGDIPAIALTAYARAEDRMKALASGFQKHLTKPVEATELVATIAGLSDGKPGPQAGAAPA